MLVAFASPTAAGASPNLQIGVLDDGYVKGNPDAAFADLDQLAPHVLRVFLWWKDVAPSRPTVATDPADAAYTGWGPYDALVRRAADPAAPPPQKILFTILGTPRWANGGRRWKYAPARASDYRNFVHAAASRYSGTFLDPANPSVPLPAVTLWTAWNEPNLPMWLTVPKYRSLPLNKSRRKRALAYKNICAAARAGAFSGGGSVPGKEKVACGVTSPAPFGGRAIAPLDFLRLFRSVGGSAAPIWAHNAHARSKRESPWTPPSVRNAITLGNIGKLTRALGGGVRLWITEYGYQTDPPDPIGVSLSRQAYWLKRAYGIARAHPRIDLLTWFLIRDEVDLNGPARFVPGWQSGFIRANGTTLKPSFFAFKNLPR